MVNMAVYKKADLKTLEVALEVSITKLKISIYWYNSSSYNFYLNNAIITKLFQNLIQLVYQGRSSHDSWVKLIIQTLHRED